MKGKRRSLPRSLHGALYLPPSTRHLRVVPSIRALHPTSGYSPAEEVANTLTHALGLLLGLAGLTVAVTVASRHAGAWLVTATAIYGTSIVALYSASTLYHAVRDLRWKRRFLILDHASIYLLIAGTYTPFTLGPLRGPAGWTLFGIIWALAIAGVIKECIVARRGGLFSSILYLAMGWLVAGFIFPLYVSVPLRSFLLILIGGIIYSIGVVFYLWRRLPYHHAVWHLFVVGGTVCQYFAVLSILQDP